MAIQLNKSFAYDAAATTNRFWISFSTAGTVVGQYGTGLKGASATSAIFTAPVNLNVYGFWAAVGTATGTAASALVQVTTASTGITTATITGAQSVTPYIVNVNLGTYTGTTTTTFSNAKVVVGTGHAQQWSSLLPSTNTTASYPPSGPIGATPEGGWPMAQGDQLYFVTGTDATADTVFQAEVGYGPRMYPIGS